MSDAACGMRNSAGLHNKNKTSNDHNMITRARGGATMLPARVAATQPRRAPDQQLAAAANEAEANDADFVPATQPDANQTNAMEQAIPPPVEQTVPQAPVVAVVPPPATQTVVAVQNDAVYLLSLYSQLNSPKRRLVTRAVSKVLRLRLCSCSSMSNNLMTFPCIFGTCRCLMTQTSTPHTRQGRHHSLFRLLFTSSS